MGGKHARHRTEAKSIIVVEGTTLDRETILDGGNLETSKALVLPKLIAELDSVANFSRFMAKKGNFEEFKKNLCPPKQSDI